MKNLCVSLKLDSFSCLFIIFNPLPIITNIKKAHPDIKCSQMLRLDQRGRKLLRLYSVPQEAEGGGGEGKRIGCATAGACGKRSRLEDRPETTGAQPPEAMALKETTLIMAVQVLCVRVS